MRTTATVWLGAAALVAACLGAAAGAAATPGAVLDGNGTQVVDNSLDSDQDNSDSKSLQELCAAKHVVSCLKLSLYRGLERLSHRPYLELLPGLTVTGDMTSLQDLSRDVTSGRLDDQLLRSLTRYLASLSLTARVMDGGVIQRIREMGDVFTQGPEDSTATGRRKRFGSSMMMAGMMSGGSLMALAMSAIAMMAGKALMTALLSLMMSAMMTMNGGGGKGGGGGGGGEKVSYEIIHTGHDIKHRSMDPATAPEAYPYLAPQAVVRRNILIPLHRR